MTNEFNKKKLWGGMLCALGGSITFLASSISNAYNNPEILTLGLFIGLFLAIPGYLIFASGFIKKSKVKERAE